MNNNLGLIIRNGNILASSRDVAKNYKKDHADVLKKIRGFIEIVPELNEGSFSLVDYIDEKGEKRPEYQMDRQGFSILVNKFTGEEALKFTVKYTKAFEEMSKELQQPKASCIEDLIIMQARGLKEAREKAEKAEAMAQIAVSKVQQLESKVEKKMTDDFSMQLVTPSQIGKMLEPALSAKEVNKKIQEAGLQWRVGGEWVATVEGKKYSSSEPVQLENGKMVYQLKWQRRVKDFI